MVVEDHVRRDVGEGPGNPRDGGGEDLDGFDLAEEAGALLGVALLGLAPLLRRVRLVGIVDVAELRLPVLEMVVGDLARGDEHVADVVERTPQARAPRQQVQGDELSVGQQMVGAVGGGEAADLPDEVAAAQRRELDRVDGDVAVVDRQRLGKAEHVAPDGVDLAQQAAAEVVGVDLVAREEQLLGAVRQVGALGLDDVVEVAHRLGTVVVGAPARPMGEAQVGEHGRRGGERREAIELVAEGEVQRRRGIDAGEPAVSLLVLEQFQRQQVLVVDRDVVAVDRPGGDDGALGLGRDDGDVQVGAEASSRHRPRGDDWGIALDGARAGGPLHSGPHRQIDLGGVAKRDPHRHRVAGDPPEDRSCEDHRERHGY